MSSYLIRGGIIIDGTGARAFIGDLMVEGGCIVEVCRRADLAEGESVLDAAERLAKGAPGSGGGLRCDRCGGPDRVIEAAGLAVTPGFIDIHTHSDLSILAAPDASAKLLQGVTTDVIGNCSIGPAPLNGAAHEYFTGWRRYEASWLERAGVKWPVWPRWSQYSEVLAATDRSINVAGLVGHGPLRASVVGRCDKPATDEELAAMKMLLEDAMEAGAFGMSTGLTYIPSCYGDTAEIIELARVVSRYDGLYASHIRGEDGRLLESVGEAIRIGGEAGASVQIAHHKAVGRSNWGRVHQSLRRIRDARSTGIDVAVDMYPYCYCGTYPGPLWGVLPRSAAHALQKLRDGDPDGALESDVRGWLAQNAGIACDPEGVHAAAPELAWDEVFIVEHPEAGLTGSTVAQAAAAEGISCSDWFLANALEERVRAKKVLVSEADLRTVLSAPECSIGSDTYAMNATEVFTGTWLHPRNFGAYARVLARYVRQERVLGWEEAVRKMSLAPALRLGISDRGVVRRGMRADLAIWSPAGIEERGHIGAPFAYASGMEWVFVNGSPAVARGVVTGARPGVFIEKT